MFLYILILCFLLIYFSQSNFLIYFQSASLSIFGYIATTMSLMMPSPGDLAQPECLSSSLHGPQFTLQTNSQELKLDCWNLFWRSASHLSQREIEGLQEYPSKAPPRLRGADIPSQGLGRWREGLQDLTWPPSSPPATPPKCPRSLGLMCSLMGGAAKDQGSLAWCRGKRWALRFANRHRGRMSLGSSSHSSPLTMSPSHGNWDLLVPDRL